jgi:hypothetical protein
VDNRTFVLGIAGLGALAALAATVPGSGGPRGAGPAASAAESGRARPRGLQPYHHGADLLEAFLGKPLAGGTLRREGYDLDVLIASLADPVESHLDWAFDSELEAIRRAYERSGYVTDRFWLPPPGLVVLGSGTDTSSVPAREVYPAVLLFRHVAADQPALRLLYLVGEVPTLGIHKVAFTTALRERDALLAASGAAPGTRRTIRVLGPAFSGSAVSLRVILEKWFEGAGGGHSSDRVVVVSGSATSGGNRTAISLAGRVTFQTTVHTDETMAEALRVVLDSLRIDDSQVAVLREATTQYGFAIGSRTQGFLDLPFPMNISSLRAEYARNPAALAPGASGALPGAAAPPRVPLSLEDSARPRESPPVTSALTAASADVLLDAIAQTLRDHKVRVVGLVATDVRDKLFLGTEIRKRVRDVQLFTYESNVLYLRPDLNEWLRGMLVFSTYPLFLHNQLWTPSRNGSQQVAFASDGAEGVYNAALTLLGNDALLAEYGEPMPSAAALDSPQAPPVWVTAVGRTSFLPVKAVPRRDSLIYQAPPRAAAWLGLAQPLLPIGFPGFAATLVLALVICMVAVRSLASEGRRADRADVAALQAPSSFGPPPAGTLRPAAPAPADWDRLGEIVRAASLLVHAELYAVLLFIALGAMFAPAAVLVWRAAGGIGWPVPLVRTLLALVVLLWGVATVRRAGAAIQLAQRYGAIGWRYLWGSFGPWGKRLLWGLEVGARGLVVVAALVYAYLTTRYTATLWRTAQLDSPDFQLLFHRASQIDGGLSPLLPLIALGVGFATWCVWHLERVALLSQRTSLEEASHRREQPQKKEGDEEQSLWDAIADVRSRLFLVIPDARALYLLVFLAVLSLWLWPQFGRSTESLIMPELHFQLSAFDLLFRLAVVGTLAATPWAAYRLLAVWSALQECLRRLGASPLVEAFDRLPARIARLTRLTLFAVPPPDVIGDVAVTQWKHLNRIFQEKQEQFSALLAGQGDVLGSIQALDTAPRPRMSRQEERREAKAVGLADVYAILERLWSLEPTVTEIDRAVAEVAKPGAADTTSMLRHSFADPVRLWLRLAEEFVAVQVVDYLEWVLRQLRILAVFLLLALLLTTGLLSCYPFQPQTLIKLVFFFIVAGTIGTIVFVMSRLNRDEVLSRITKTEPGQITWNSTFILNLLVFGAVPLLTLISSEFPAVRDLLFSWFSPILKAAAKT